MRIPNKIGRTVLLLLLGLAWGGAGAFAQNPSFCHFMPSKGDKGVMDYGGDQRAASSSYTIRIWVHIIRETGGSGGQTDAQVETGLEIMELDYLPEGICFVEVGRSEIWQSGLGVGSLGSLLATYGHADAIDCFLLPETTPGGGGLASGIPGEGFTIGGTLFGLNMVPSHVISHEMGHCLGLWHTHQSGSPSCPELVNGSNCTTCGDFICDTPADPFLNFNVSTTTCQWLSSGFDSNGDPYNPDELNIMSYTQPSCMAYFTPGQGQRMRTAIANEPILQAVCIPDFAYRQNGTISSGGEVVTGKLLVAAGSFVDGGQPFGPYTVTGSAVVDYVADASGGMVTLMPGFSAFPGAGGVFTARTEDFCAPNGGMRLAPDSQGQAPALVQQAGRPEQAQAALEAERAMQLEAYPNPFGDKFHLALGLPKADLVNGAVYNAAGQKIAVFLEHEALAEGQYAFELDASEWAKGMYMVRLEAGGEVLLKRMVKY